MTKRFVFLVFLYWFVIINLLSAHLLSSIRSFIDIAEIDPETLNETAKIWLSLNQYIESTLFSFLFAALFLIIHQFAERRDIGRMSFGKIILTKSLLYIIGFGIISFIIYFIMAVNLNIYSDVDLSSIRFTPYTFISIVSYVLLVFILIINLNFIIQASKTFGYSNLHNFISGKYHTPQIEDRVFLFIDLKDSTTYAEKLGNIKYSMLIQDCFDDLNTLILKYKAEIYQYVGDEVVVTWNADQLHQNPYCLNLFFDFKKLLKSKSEYYTTKYGLVPEFKAGINGGEVTATEIGDIKRDIAYHGDVLNTASRIQGACNTYEQILLIEAGLFNKLKNHDKYQSTLIPNIKLKGKQEGTDVFAVNIKAI